MITLPRKNSKKDQKEFKQTVLEYLSEYGATESSHYYENSYKIDTELGDFHVTVRDDNETVYSIYGCFEDVEQAKEGIQCNPYTGKYNFHSDNKTECLRQFASFLSRYAWKSELIF
jgi:hypothetical protein